MLSIVRRVLLALITVWGLYSSILAFQSAPRVDYYSSDNKLACRPGSLTCVVDSQTAFLRGTFTLLLTVAAFGACLLILKDEPRRGANARGTEDLE